MTLCLIFPPTNPIALLVLLVKDWKRGITPAVCYLLAVVALPVGGAIAVTMEKGRLMAYEQELIDSGETLSVQSLIPDPVSVQSNIWAHPYLAPLGVAGQGTKEGEAARTTARYASMRLPPPDAKIKYVDEGQQSGQLPLRELHLRALSIVSGRDGMVNESNTPQSWEACGEILVAHFKKAEDDFAQLARSIEAPLRPISVRVERRDRDENAASCQVNAVHPERRNEIDGLFRNGKIFRIIPRCSTRDKPDSHWRFRFGLFPRGPDGTGQERFKHVEGGATVPRLERRTMVGGSGPTSRDGFPGSDSGFDKGRCHLKADRNAEGC